MILHDCEAEKLFIDRFDAGRFPYEGPLASTIIHEGWGISLNAAFCVLNELCRPPHGGCVSEGRMVELVSEWTTGPDHPLKAPLVQAARALIQNRPLPTQDGVAIMRRVSEYDGQRAALNIAYFASDCDTPEENEALECTHAEIVQSWAAKGV
jgi:hypothetical protein